MSPSCSRKECSSASTSLALQAEDLIWLQAAASALRSGKRKSVPSKRSRMSQPKRM